MSSSRDHRRQLYERLVGQPVAGGRFVITRLLGFGGMGAVYEAIQKNMDRKVALKLIPTHDPTIVARFEREALTISKLQHPNTITVFDFGQSEDGFLFLSMELLEGHTLTEQIKLGPIEPERAVHIATQMCRSLAEAHRAGIVHRDVKPDNIILIRVDDDPDVVKVLDFGIAKAVMGEDDVQLTGDGRIIGTPRYMSPEQILAEPLDHRSDIYSLGCILFEMLCGAPPFQQQSTTALMISHTQDPPPAFAQQLDPSKMSMMPHGLELVVRRALSKSPNDRQQDCDQLREELEAALTGSLAPGFEDLDAGQTAAAMPPAAASQSGAIPQADVTGAAPAAASGGPKLLVGGIVALVVIIVALVGVSQLKKGPPPTPAPQTNGATAVAAHTTAKPAARTETAEQTPPANTAAQRPAMVMLSIKSAPTGARVYEGDGFLGTTPLTIPVKAELNKHHYRLVKDGYKDLVVSVPINPEQPKQERSYALERKKSSHRHHKRHPSKPVTKTKPDDTKANVPRLDDGPKANVGLLH